MIIVICVRNLIRENKCKLPNINVLCDYIPSIIASGVENWINLMSTEVDIHGYEPPWGKCVDKFVGYITIITIVHFF